MKMPKLLDQSKSIFPERSAMVDLGKFSYNLSPRVLYVLGLVDLLRGVLHTFFSHWANDTFAHLNLSANGQDQLMLLSAFGISNLLTGSIYILISMKAKELARPVLILILGSYFFGWLGIQYAGISPNADFLGRYFMASYFLVIILTLVFAKNEK
jgi:hypothetical protein